MMGTTRVYNGGSHEGRTEWFSSSSPTVDEVLRTIRDLSEGLLDPRVDFIRDSDPYGGFDSVGVEVIGLIAGATA